MKRPTLTSFLELGFEPLTEWEIRKDKIKPKAPNWIRHSGWLYAFVVDEMVKYVGLTTRVLDSRMDDYSYITEEQCAHKRSLIFAEIESGKSVWIYGKPEADEDELVRVEFQLRDEFDLPWNRN